MASMPRNRPDIQVFDEIGAIARLLRQSITRQLPPGIAYVHFELLLHFVREGDGQTPAQLARTLMLTKGALTSILQRMSALGLVAVFADVSDGRKKRVRVTRDGVETYLSVVKGLRADKESLRSAFTEGEFRDALPFLRALKVFLEDVEPDERSAERR
ncbi:MarR family winged helix-turn-helix transcriptional regulator [Phenylobacterium sp.]|jgi:DNA-binding MarR family transcriptional regulator|uniref:MarR family winged helix-turn-helix transcriptional regulator n=1 Tax=Phenylobacterium sp. TaxID=1871053 RepID=UPI002F3FB6DE